MATKATADNDVHVALTQAPESGKGAALVQQAQDIVIRDKASHEVCREFLKGAKALKRKIEEHYAAIKSPLNAARATVLDMERKDLAPVLLAIDVADKIDTAYVREQRRIEEQAAEDARLKAEAEEVKRRQKEADRAEAAALKLEESSENLSSREAMFVAKVAAGASENAAARLSGYANPEQAAKRLMQSAKIIAAIDNQRKAQRIREASEAKQAAPINVEVVTKASEIVDGGVRAYYGCQSADVMTLAKAIVSGHVAASALQPNMVFLNEQARSLKNLFEQAYPGCVLARRDGTVGR